MWQNAHDAYLESRVLSAGPLELVGLLYEAATGAVRDARQRLAEGDIRARARSISKACDILFELAGSLDYSQGGSISQNLARLYDYMTRRLIEANFQQKDEPLAEVLGLLTTLSEGWEGARAQESSGPVVEAANSWGEPAPYESGARQASQVWSF